ncbi:acyltransferase family protein [Planococcus glaciei]|uniref:acyltransferase family protein n=1 Tax=Planococcus glaciei TaxID=459472 RepID=UPI001C739F3C|nr:acyltransferase family protein [Planococcus glaciei]MBX0313271.1 acyltransferase family protein [Planococcus glaciei]
MKKLKEINMIRALMCIMVVMTHSLTQYTLNIEMDLTGNSLYVQYFRLALLCATPIFILLSETMIAKNYSGTVPKNFFLKRIKFILIPYVLIGLIVSYMRSDHTLASFREMIQMIIIEGEWYGFFIIVIFQFYVLHWLVGRLLAKINPILPLALAFFVSLLHSYSYFHVGAYQEFTLSYYPLFFRTHILFWLFYFVAGFYVGLYYEKIMDFLINKVWMLELATVASFAFIINVYQKMNYVTIASERFDMIPYTISIFLLLLVAFRKYQFYNETMMVISNFSFFIYLTHLIILPYFVHLTLDFGENILIFNTVLCFLTIASCMGGAFLFYQNRFTRYITGRIAYLDSSRPEKDYLKPDKSLQKKISYTQ